MPRRSKRDILNEARPTVEALIASLHKSKDTVQANAVQAVLEIAEGAVQAAQHRAEREAGLNQPFAVPVEAGLWRRIDENSPNISADLVEGWEKFLAGEWVPEKPVRAGHGQGAAKSPVNVRVPRELTDRVEAAAAALVAEKGWPTGRGYLLNARQIAAQWLARKYPAPAGESEAAAE